MYAIICILFANIGNFILTVYNIFTVIGKNKDEIIAFLEKRFDFSKATLQEL